MYNILICDDEEDIVFALKIYLKNPDYCFFEAHNGKEALDIIKEQHMDLLLLDMMMPVMEKKNIYISHIYSQNNGNNNIIYIFFKFLLF